ncbi:MAG: hypothetical protein E7618_01500 [Ruminococcaceae bacterium]|nr:hypothetical protein [Oscillospiraceae bacterium]
MKKLVALLLFAILMVAAVIPASAAGNPFTFDTDTSVTKWQNKTSKVNGEMPPLDPEDFYAATEGQNGTGAFLLDTDAMGCPDKASTIVELVCYNCIDVKKDQTVIVRITAKGNKPTAKSGSRLALRLMTAGGVVMDGASRCYVVQDGSGTYSVSETEVTPTEDIVGVNLVTLTITAGTVIYIDSIEIVDKATGASVFNSAVLDTEAPVQTQPATTQAPAQSETDNTTAPDNGDTILSLALLGMAIVPTVVVVTRKSRRAK